MTKVLKIAVADDERDMREYLHEVLPRLGHQVVAVAETGRKLVEQCRSAHPDLVITDIKMPDLDGIETSVAINRERQTPVILVSAHHEAETLARVAADHVMGYLVKPVSEADLKTAISMAMLRHTHFLAMLEENAHLKQTLEDRKVVERAKGVLMKRLRVDEDEAFRRLRKMASAHNLKLVAISRQVMEAEDIFAQLEKI